MFLNSYESSPFGELVKLFTEAVPHESPVGFNPQSGTKICQAMSGWLKFVGFLRGVCEGGGVPGEA